MSETAPAENDVSPPAASARFEPMAGDVPLAGAGRGSGGVRLVRLASSRQELGRATWTLLLMLAIGSLLANGWAMVQRRRAWLEPLEMLRDLVPRIRGGELPIEELSRVPGGLAPAAALFQELLRDLRRQRVELARLNEETSQRVANRTHALERTIGSLRQQATRDVLTGLNNRRALKAHLPAAVERCKTSGAGLCLLMMDVDYFKTLNDTLGHAAGDGLLRTIGQIIRSTVREGDLAFRCGGDEFVVLIEGCSIEAGNALAERLISLVDALGRTFHVPHAPRLSIGVASLAELDDPTPAALLQQADKHLYDVKGARRAAAGVSRDETSPLRSR